MATLECRRANSVEETLETPRAERARFPWIAIVWGVVLAAFVCRIFLTLRFGQFFENHDGNGYGLRLIEFRDCLWAGYLLPQWCPHFRGGLGAPFFNYYQPGFFYVASLTPSVLPVAQQIGLAVFLFSIIGYLGMFSLIGTRFGTGAGMLAGTFLLTAPYIHTELYLRGDFSEYAAMMLVPAALSFFLQFLERPRPRSGALGAISLAAIVMTHPAIALALYGLLTIALLGASVVTKSLPPAKRGLLVLGFGVGLSSVYWLPVFLESRYSSVERMWDGQIFDGYYHYSRHFLSLAWLFDRSVTSTPIPVKLGLFHTLISGAGLISCLGRWRRLAVDQRHVTGLCLLVGTASLFLISRQSAGLWDHLPLLGRIQFPWRLLSLVSVSMGGLAGLATFARRVTKLRSLVTLVLCGILAWTAATRAHPKPIRYSEPRTARDIADHFFAPDLADEWLPRDAQSFQMSLEQRQPMMQPPAKVSDYRSEQGVLACQLQTTAKSSVVLPHYYFPVGFAATLNGTAVTLKRTNLGLMRVDVPADFEGTLQVSWSTTPAKQAGLLVSLVTLLVGLLALMRTWTITQVISSGNSMLR